MLETRYIGKPQKMAWFREIKCFEWFLTHFVEEVAENKHFDAVFEESVDAHVL